MTRHVGAETLAAFRQGDLSPRRNSRIRAHLAGCARCSDLNEDLAGVTTLLAGAQPPPIPEHLAARIQTALATEAARRVALTAGAAETPAGGTRTEAERTGAERTGAERAGAEPAGIAGPGVREPAPGGRTPRHERPGRGRRRLPGLASPVALRAMAAAAAAVVVAGGAYEIAQHVGGSSSSQEASPSGAAAPRAAQGHRASSGSSSASVPAAAPNLRYQHDRHEDSVTPITTSTDFTAANLRSQVSRELTRYGPAMTGSPSGGRSPAAGPARQPATVGSLPLSTLEGCVNRIAAGELVLLVDVARYQGAPATVIVTEVSAASPEQVWVVGTGCSGSRSDVLAQVTVAPAG